VTGSSYSAVYKCLDSNSNFVGWDKTVCKPGILLPLSTTKKNVVIIGDSLSIGYTPDVAADLADIALVQHAPADVSDGGAEETQTSMECLDYWLASPSGIPLTGPNKVDLILYNSGMHNLVVNCSNPGVNGCVPGQSGNSSIYGPQLAQVMQRLVNFTQTTGAKLAYALTTPYLCDASIDAVISGTLNPAAAAIARTYNVPVIDLHTAIVQKCGAAPQPACDGIANCWCPHCPGTGPNDGYPWLARTTLAPFLRSLLTQA
jgi:hypothetical protein